MGFSKESAAERAKSDLAERLNIEASEITEKSISDREFPDMSLGAPAEGEFSAQMIAYGWVIDLEAAGKTYEYRADKYQIRLKDFEGKNHVVV
jgi:hypothetical protein